MSIYNMLGYGHPARIMPEWQVGYLVFQQGRANLKRSSLTGGGQIYARDYSGTFTPIVVMHAGPTTSMIGGGHLAANMPYLTSLFANPSGANSGS